MNDELTQKDIEKMQEEIDYRKTEVRTKALEDLKEAKSHGDLSENFEYYAAKRFHAQNESRIRYLEKMITTARIISDHSAEDEVGLYNLVRVEFLDDGTEEVYKIVTTVRSNSLDNLIPNDSPLGKALLGRKVGDVVHVKVNETIGYDVRIVHIEKTEDDGSDELRRY